MEQIDYTDRNRKNFYSLVNVNIIIEQINYKDPKYADFFSLISKLLSATSGSDSIKRIEIILDFILTENEKYKDICSFVKDNLDNEIIEYIKRFPIKANFHKKYSRNFTEYLKDKDMYKAKKLVNNIKNERLNRKLDNEEYENVKKLLEEEGYVFMTKDLFNNDGIYNKEKLIINSIVVSKQTKKMYEHNPGLLEKHIEQAIATGSTTINFESIKLSRLMKD